MSFRRKIIPDSFSVEGELTAELVGCGFKLAHTAKPQANIENTIFAASIEGMAGDFRLLSLLVDWLDIHSGQLIADRLFKLVSITSNPRVKAFWTAVAKWKHSDSRFRRFSRLYRGPRIDLLFSGTEYHLKQRGEDPRFKHTPLRVPHGVGLRHRPSDVMTPRELAEIHSAYRYRLIIGSTYRADMWAALELQPDLGPADLARHCYGSFATAWEVKQQWNIVNSSAA